jgi:hypothetical protein
MRRWQRVRRPGGVAFRPSYLCWTSLISAVAAAALTGIAAIVMVGVVPMAVIVVIVACSSAAIVGAAGTVGATATVVVAFSIGGAVGAVHAPGGCRINVQLFDTVRIAVFHGLQKRITVLAPQIIRLSRHYCWRSRAKDGCKQAGCYEFGFHG